MNALEWLHGLAARREFVEKRALADRLRRELAAYESRLSTAVAILESATAEAADAEAACRVPPATRIAGADERYELARETRRLAGEGFDLARRQVSLRTGVLRQLEQELAVTNVTPDRP